MHTCGLWRGAGHTDYTHWWRYCRPVSAHCAVLSLLCQPSALSSPTVLCAVCGVGPMDSYRARPTCPVHTDTTLTLSNGTGPQVPAGQLQCLSHGGHTHNILITHIHVSMVISGHYQLCWPI